MKQRIVPILLVVLPLAACQSYKPLPLDPEAHESAWAGRSPGDERVRAYAERIAALNPDAAAPYDPADGLDLREAEMVALVFNPELRVARLKARVPAVGAKLAGLWDDPGLDVDLLRVTSGIPDPWILGAGLGFTIPLSGRLSVEKSRAEAEADVELRRALLAEWRLVARLRVAWARWTGVRERIALIESYLSELDSMLALAERQRAANRIGAPQLRVLQMERASRAGALTTLRIREERRRLAVLALLGLTPDAAVELVAGLPLDAPDVAAGERRAQLRDHNLELTVARAEYEVADQVYRLELRRQYPDVTLGPAYGNEDGESRIGFVMGLPIPLWNRNRRAIAEAEAARDAAKAGYEQEFERLVAELFQADLGLREARANSAYLEESVAPMVDRQMSDLRRLAELGDLDVLVLLDALTRTLDTKAQVLDAKVEESVAGTELRVLLRPLETPPPEVNDDG